MNESRLKVVTVRLFTMCELQCERDVVGNIGRYESQKWGTLSNLSVGISVRGRGSLSAPGI